MSEVGSYNTVCKKLIKHRMTKEEVTFTLVNFLSTSLHFMDRNSASCNELLT